MILGSARKDNRMNQTILRRIAKAEPLLETFRTKLHRSGAYSCHEFETEVGKCWRCGFQIMKSRVMDLSKHPRYVFLAAYYMENSNGSRRFVASEFKSTLAKLYGVSSYENARMKTAREALWKTMPRE